MKHFTISLVVLLLFSFSGCAVYEISTKSLITQLQNTGTEEKGYLSPGSVQGNTLQTVICTDKHGKQVSLYVTNRTGVRITLTDNSRKTFYFNTLLVQDSAVSGSKTHFFNSSIKPVKFSNIIKIEIMP